MVFLCSLFCSPELYTSIRTCHIQRLKMADISGNFTTQNDSRPHKFSEPAILHRKHAHTAIRIAATPGQSPIVYIIQFFLACFYPRRSRPGVFPNILLSIIRQTWNLPCVLEQIRISQFSVSSLKFNNVSSYSHVLFQQLRIETSDWCLKQQRKVCS